MVAYPIEAMSVVSANDPRAPGRRKAKVDEGVCLGCGVCERACPSGSIALRSRGARVVTPVTSPHRTVLMAMKRGTLQDLVFDNRALTSHRAMAAILGAILRMPPAKRLLASQQLRSKYLTALLDRLGF
jgi:ferredoxin